tara:strand:- start:219 stop:398 length:180 start_codon:yes stop_codon:yes gene_type:complete
MLKIDFEFQDDWARGEEDAKAGIPHAAGKSKEYDQGYGFEKTKQNMADHWSEKQNVNSN